MENEGIKKFPPGEFEEYRKEPLLEYVVEISDELWKDFDPESIFYDEEGNLIEDGYVESDRPCCFGKRLNCGEIDTSREEKYLNHRDLQDTLRAFGLDRDKFWYLCLMLKDVMEAHTKNSYKKPNNPLEELQGLYDLICKVDKDNQGELMLNVGEETATASNRMTMDYIKGAMAEALQKAKEELISKFGRHTFVSTGLLDEKVTLPLMYQITYFHNLLMPFLKKREAQKDIHASKDKMLLISRMIYVLGISDDKRYDTEYAENGDKLNFLKNNIRRYKNLKLDTYQTVYC
ncbi:MAG: hypothetical protein IKN44_05685 [Bacteroidaceae bacterium]|nr:hypothetical protein [Bacteroidaceae bacterium]